MTFLCSFLDRVFVYRDRVPAYLFVGVGCILILTAIVGVGNCSIGMYVCIHVCTDITSTSRM